MHIIIIDSYNKYGVYMNHYEFQKNKILQNDLSYEKKHNVELSQEFILEDNVKNHLNHENYNIDEEFLTLKRKTHKKSAK